MNSLIEVTPHQTNLITKHTLTCYPNEMVGVLTADSFIPLTNIAKEPAKNFSIDPIAYAKVIDKTIAIVHSHCRNVRDHTPYDLRTPSLADITNQKRSKKPWLIVGTEGEIVTPALQFPRIPNSNYIGRSFIWYVNDCYNLVEDYYRYSMNIILPGKDISFDWTKLSNLSDAFTKYISDYNFTDIYKVEDIRKGDLLLMDRNGVSASHLGIYEDGYVIHQDNLSRRQPLSHFIGNIRRILRYAS